MTTIDEARKAIERWFAETSAGYVEDAPGDAIRTLLAHTADYDALKGRLEEAVRLLNECWGRIPTWCLPDGLNAFLDREKEAGRG